jgi:hypothetical protein
MLSCGECGTSYTAGDAFCRKCGVRLTEQSASAGTEKEKPVVLEGDILNADGTPVRGRFSTAISKFAGEKLTQAANSETGKKLAKGASAMALTVGAQLVAKAVARKTGEKPQTTRNKKNQPATVSDQLIQAFEDFLASDRTKDKRNVERVVEEEEIIEERYTRRRVRRRVE